MATWFEELFGFAEESHACVHHNIAQEDGILVSRANGKRLVCGSLETPSLEELRGRARKQSSGRGVLNLREVRDVRHLHREASAAGSLFQVASQFYLLEMASPSAIPEMGLGIYENDHTQGPACAIAAGAGTTYRNYFTIVHGRVGQTTTKLTAWLT